MLEEAGVGIGRVQIDQRDGKDEHTFVKALEEFTARVKQLEPTRMQDKSPNEGCLAESERTCRRNIT
jgi:coenzyme F420-reducing hydrogenase delta subunit